MVQVHEGVMEARTPAENTDSSSEQKNMDNFNDSSPGPVVLEMELPPPNSEMDKEEEAEKANKRIIKKINRLKRQLDILFYAVLISPIVVIGVIHYGHIHLINGWVWFFVSVLYFPILVYGMWRICAGFCVTKPLSPAELAYLQENED